MNATIYFDFETGGLQAHHPNIQLAAIAVDQDFSVLGEMECKIQFDESKAEPEALKINHYSPEEWKNAVPERFALSKFAAFLEPFKCIPMVSKRTGKEYSVAKLAGHNAATFDGPRLKEAFQRNQIFLPADPRVRCTCQRAMWWFDERGERPADFKLETLCKYFGIDTAGNHDAFTDVRLTIELAKALRKQ